MTANKYVCDIWSKASCKSIVTTLSGVRVAVAYATASLTFRLRRKSCSLVDHRTDLLSECVVAMGAMGWRLVWLTVYSAYLDA